MEQEGIGPNGAEAGSFADKAELKTADLGILHQLYIVSFMFKCVLYCETQISDVIVRITTFSTIAGCVPRPLFFSCHMMKQHDRRDSFGHESSKEMPFSFLKAGNSHRGQGAARPYVNQALSDFVYISHVEQ